MNNKIMDSKELMKKSWNMVLQLQTLVYIWIPTQKIPIPL